MSMPKLNVLGCGKVARVLARLFAAHQVFQVQDILNRSQESSARALLFVGSGRAVERLQDMRSAKFWLLGVNDDAIISQAHALQQAHKLRAGDTVFHCSGALSAQALDFLQASGVRVASVHPIRSFADTATVYAQFEGTYCSLEGDAHAQNQLQDALRRIGAQVLLIDGAHKALYHAASAIACNFMSTLLETAYQNWEKAGLTREQAERVATPLVRETLDNILRMGPAAALTGPIARGDWQTVDKHRAALAQANPQHAALYEAFVPLTAALAQTKK
ncbi:DUF2520 domain-containing protein [Massilia sp. W12]|uniref:Rossmann-like and DUF2520 domain-containing protein n=1 Tax=Massilia sp. W12 TaxID=3126507 RepID=UPI0030D0D4F4